MKTPHDIWWESKTGYPGTPDFSRRIPVTGGDTEWAIIDVKQIDATPEEIDALHEFLKQHGGSTSVPIEEWLEQHRSGDIGKKAADAYDRAMKGI